MNRRIPNILLLFLFFLLQLITKGQEFSFAKPITILYSKEAPKLDSIAAHLFSEDIKNVTGHEPKLITDSKHATGNVIVIGNITSNLVQNFIGKQSTISKSLMGKWECFGLKIIDKPTNLISKALIIAGSDRRGTAYGVFTISEKIGVSPWYWWADVPVKKQKSLILRQPEFLSTSPSVKYRGIFINDEDWGLQPWAAKTFEPEINDIGPKTYAKVFELLLRLKANLIWPAMHPGTKAFYHYPPNKQVAEDYAIVIGSSHAEPMLRNNVDEWNEKTTGPFNYLTNKNKVLDYWESRVAEIGNQEVMFTVGMRGVHDSQMEGVKDAKEAVPVLERIIQDQRNLLKKYRQKDVTDIPQVFTVYKEVLDVYDNGLKLPDDITIGWPDDNYGYIQRLNNEEEKKRSGGSGVYYHVSYWGRPHDYLWLNTTHPSLIREEMMKAFDNGSDRLWVLNVGDIKPAEYDIQLFMDMAYNADAFRESKSVKKHLQNWTGQMFGKENAPSLTGILWKYYRLAFERRPEFMGWSQTEPTTQTKYTSYNHFSFGDEAQKRIDRYTVLENEVREIRKKISLEKKDAFYQLVYYPVVGASWMNKKFLYRDKAFIYSKQNRISAYDFAIRSMANYDSIVKETTFYNEQLSGGKWKGIMSMKPRELPVYLTPSLPELSHKKVDRWDVAPEGYDTTAYGNKLEKKLPDFISGLRQSYFIDVYLNDSIIVDWKAKPSASWIKLSLNAGKLFPKESQNSVRLWVRIDWVKAPLLLQANNFIVFSSNGKSIRVRINVVKKTGIDFENYKGFVEDKGIVSVYASHFTARNNKAGSKWQTVNELGHTGNAIQSVLQLKNLDQKPDTTNVQANAAVVTYTFYSFSTAAPIVSVYTLPTHPLNTNFGMRYAISIDDDPATIVSFKTIGRSEEWKQNVLRNSAIREIKLKRLKPGVHTLKIYVVDPGVVLDRIIIRFDDVLKNYGVIPETTKSNSSK